MKILVVGGAGYVGGAVTDLLDQADHDILVYDSLLYEDSYRKSVPFVRGDIRDHERLLPHLMWADCVIWLAAIVGDGACALDPASTFEINEAAVHWLADVFPGRIIFLSTCSVYGAQDGVLHEDSPTNPLSVYAATKLAAESYLSHSNALIFRLGTLFGISDTYSRVRFDLVLNTLTLRAHRTGKITVFGGNQYRPLLHVRDAAQAIVDNLANRQAGIYNLRSENFTITELADRVAYIFPGLEITRTEQHFQDHRNYRVSATKASRELRFYPRRRVNDGINEIKRLLEEGRLRNPDDSRYANEKFLFQNRAMEATK